MTFCIQSVCDVVCCKCVERCDHVCVSQAQQHYGAVYQAQTEAIRDLDVRIFAFKKDSTLSKADKKCVCPPNCNCSPARLRLALL